MKMISTFSSLFMKMNIGLVPLSPHPWHLSNFIVHCSQFQFFSVDVRPVRRPNDPLGDPTTRPVARRRGERKRGWESACDRERSWTGSCHGRDHGHGEVPLLEQKGEERRGDGRRWETKREGSAGREGFSFFFFHFAAEASDLIGRRKSILRRVSVKKTCAEDFSPQSHTFLPSLILLLFSAIFFIAIPLSFCIRPYFLPFTSIPSFPPLHSYFILSFPSSLFSSFRHPSRSYFFPSVPIFSLSSITILFPSLRHPS